MLKRFTELGRLPRKPPISGYNLFVSRQKGKSGNTPQENLKMCAECYQKLGEINKEKLREEVAIMKQNYENKMSKLLETLEEENIGKTLDLK